MSAKAYKSKIVEPLIERLKSFAKKILVHYFAVKDENNKLDYYNSQLTRENSDLSKTVARLSDENKYLRAENKQLKEQNKDYKLLRKVFGKDEAPNLSFKYTRGIATQQTATLKM